MSIHRLWLGAIFGVLLFGPALAEEVKKDEVTDAEINAKRAEVEELRKQLAMTVPVRDVNPVDEALENRYGPNASVISSTGKLTLGGLIQVWYYSIENDNHGWYDDDAYVQPTLFGSNEVRDNDSFRVRRAELSFTMEVHENITAHVMIDPAREATSFPHLKQNTSTALDAAATFNAGYRERFPDQGNPVQLGNVANDNVRNGSGLANRMLQDAYINVHGLLPHHDVTIGQFLPHNGEEGIRDSAQLDFVERAMVTELGHLRDLGLTVHGTWWDDRFQYWLGVFNSAGTMYQQRSNRSDDNDEKDLLGAFLVRPLWKDETWGSLEIGYSIKWGIGGEAGGHLPHPQSDGLADDAAGGAVDGLNRRKTVHSLMYAYMMYKPGGPVKGLWLRGEWGQYRDRFAPGEVITPGQDRRFLGLAEGGIITLNPATHTVQGWYAAAGYHLGESVHKDSLPEWAHGLEFAVRYEEMENLFHHDLKPGEASTDPDFDMSNPGAFNFGIPAHNRQIDVFETRVLTLGINYYIKKYNAKLQFNYHRVDEESPDQESNIEQLNLVGAPTGVQDLRFVRFVREVRNDNFVLNFQVAW